MNIHIDSMKTYSNEWLVWIENRMIGIVCSRRGGILCYSKKEVLVAVEQLVPEIDKETVTKIDKAESELFDLKVEEIHNWNP